MSEIDYNYHYAKWHDGSDQDYSQASANYHYFMNDIISEIPENSKILDYGCGTGCLVHYLAQKFTDVIGIDADASQIRVGQNRGLPISQVDLEHFEGWCKNHLDTFDVIFLMDVLEHVPKAAQITFLQTLSSVLKHNGLMYIKVPNANSPMAARWLYIDWTHSTSFTEHSLDFICHHGKLSIDEFLPDETGIEPRLKVLIRPKLKYYYLKKIIRLIWRLYLKSEGENISDKNLLNKNLFVKCIKK